MKHLLVGILMLFAVPSVFALPSDNFDDNSRNASTWNYYESDGSTAWIDEINGRMEFRSTADGLDIDDAKEAGYSSNGWGLSVKEDFSLKVDFHHIAKDMIDTSIYFGLYLDPENNLVTGAGCFENSKDLWYEILMNDEVSEEYWEWRTDESGTFYISYDESEDELYLSITGYGQADAWKIIDCSSLWETDTVGIFMGGDACNSTLDSGNAWLDNFVIDSGTIVIIPEPVSLSIFGLGALILFRKQNK